MDYPQKAASIPGISRTCITTVKAKANGVIFDVFADEANSSAPVLKHQQYLVSSLKKDLPMLGYPTVDHSIDYLTYTLFQRTFAQ
jgi:hypothetical protein